MSTVTLRLAGPMQAWSNTPAKAVRPTQDHPTKTGVIGMIASALGRDRSDPVDDLAILRFAVRADRPGELAEDYHTAGSGTFPILPGTILANPNLIRDAAKLPDGDVLDTLRDGAYAAPAGVSEKAGGVLVGRPGDTVVRTDQYLADAIFTVALTGPRDTVDAVATALTQPARPLHLGRKDYPPTGQLLIGVTDHDDPVEALAATDVDARAAAQPWRVWTETPIDGQPSQYIADQPTNYATRRPAVRPEYITVATATGATQGGSSRGEVDFFTAPATDLTAGAAPTPSETQTPVDFFTAPQETQS